MVRIGGTAVASATPEVWDAQEAARYLRINVQTIRRLARDNDLPAFKVGGTWRFKKDSLDRWADSRHEGSRGMTVLAIEAGQQVSERLREALKGRSARVAGASDAAGALQFLQAQGADAVVLDLEADPEEGLAALEQVRRQFPAVPVVVLLARAGAETVGRALQHSPVTLLAKPFSDEQVLAAVQDPQRQRQGGPCG
jgi:excisionase family DNA binding protein